MLNIDANKNFKKQSCQIKQQNYFQMNPENVGQQIKLKHSAMWRRPLIYQKPIPQTQPCHKQLNELGMTGQSWRTRNNFISTNNSFRNKSSILRKTHSKQLDQVLHQSDKQSNLTRSMIKSLRPDAESIDRSRQLVSGMEELKKLNLLAAKDLQKVKFPGIIRHEHIYNDYHERVTNPGYSRNYLGKIYTK